MISAASWELKQNKREISFLKEAKFCGFSIEIISPKKFKAILEIFI